MVKAYFERGVKKPAMVTDCNIETDINQEHEAWGVTPDDEVKCKIRLHNSEILTNLKIKLNLVPPENRIPLIELLLK